MSSEASLETLVLIAKHLRTYTPILAAIGSASNKELRQGLVEKLAEQLESDEPARYDILKIVLHLSGQELSGIKYNELFTVFRKAWRNNNMNQVIEACVKLGIYDKPDLVNIDWVLKNWYKDNKIT